MKLPDDLKQKNWDIPFFGGLFLIPAFINIGANI
jgi:hypothetical protein